MRLGSSWTHIFALIMAGYPGGWSVSMDCPHFFLLPHVVLPKLSLLRFFPGFLPVASLVWP